MVLDDEDDEADEAVGLTDSVLAWPVDPNPNMAAKGLN